LQKRPSARELEPALDELPLFPLPAVLFPGALMPLHVFEPRYRALVKEALATHGALAVVFITDAADVDANGHPRIAGVAGAGIIVDHAELPNGRFNILVEGRARVRLEELPFSPPYRRARAKVIATPGDVPAHEIIALRAAAVAFADRVREREPRFALALPSGGDRPELTDFCAHHLVLDARERQTLLELEDPAERARRTTAILVAQRVALSGDRRNLN
jgi:ATP-dependent Lon protease